MKKLICIVFIAFAINTKGQITFEFALDSASTIAVEDQLMIVNFEVSGYQYVRIDRQSLKICIYDMSHTLVKTISFAGFPSNSGTNGTSILYLSEHLFNTDPLKEFMYAIILPNTKYYTGIYNENGVVLFSDTGIAAIYPNTPLQQYPIYNTTVGTKMILSYTGGVAKVFDLAGTLSTAIDRANTQLASNGATLANPRPNPTANTTTIAYTLPPNTNQAELVFYSVQGIEVKRFKVDNTFSSLLISTADIPAGTYYYNLQIGGNASGSKKMVVVK